MKMSGGSFRTALALSRRAVLISFSSATMAVTMSQSAESPKTTAERLTAVLGRIASAARDSGRSADGVHLVAVTKTQGEAAITAALEAGHCLFGENRVQEAERKWPAIRAKWPDVKLHLIGPLQTNKARAAVALFDAIQSVDRIKLAASLAAEMDRQKRHLQLFVQVNTGEEAQKSGVAPRDATAFVRQCKEELGLTIAGLMCIQPADEPPEPHFVMLKKIAAECGVPELSMGMSGDFEAAIRMGATYVRVGTAIFGERH
jgi:pyridoxal phosphate enzyme (YggS family)